MLSIRLVPEADEAPEGVRRRKSVPLVVALEVEKLFVVNVPLIEALSMAVNGPVALLLHAQECVVKPPAVLAAA